MATAWLPDPASSLAGTDDVARTFVPAEDGASACAHGRVASWLSASDRTAPTANQRLWDARRYSLDLTVDPLGKTIAGTTVLYATILADSAGNTVALPYIELDLDDALTVVGASYQEAPVDPAMIDHEHDLLRIPLSRPAQTGDSIEVMVRYQGTPPAPSAGWYDGLNFSIVDRKPMAWSFGGPRGARRWWPGKDYPEDKADFGVSLRVTVPRSYEVVANGRLLNRTETDSTVTFHWMERHSIATYLVGFSAYPYSVYEDWYHTAGSPADSMPIVFYNVPVAQQSWRPVQAQVKTMIRAFAEQFGEYPFLDEKYGHAQIPFSGGMEHQTITSIGSNNEAVVAHEISHSWWGNEITCRTYGDIWLNEGFATYAEALWIEATRGPAAYHARMADTKYFGGDTIFVSQTQDPGRIYDMMLSYYKGSWVLHMLRHVIGDEAFFRGLREYRAGCVRPAGDGTSETSDFAAVMSEVAAPDLQPMIKPMIHRWIMGEGYPIYRYDWTEATDGPGWAARVRLRQVQETPVFPMPVRLVVRVEDAGGDTLQTFTVESTGRDSTYTLNLTRRPLRVDVDPEEWILRRVMPPIPAPTFAKPLLVVNGVTWSGEKGTLLRAGYEARAFTAGYDFDFWDNQAAPGDGYPATLPLPIGHGPVSGEVLARYRAVLWVGDNFGSDLVHWTNSPMHAYLESGGNILLLVPSARTFLLEPYRAWLGVSWADGDSVVTSGEAMAGWLPDLGVPVESTQNAVSFFTVDSASVGKDVLLFADRGDSTRAFGLLGPPGGVMARPAGGVTGPSMGGRFALIGGRPYRWNPGDLRAAMEAILPQLLPPVSAGARLAVRTAGPNPFRNRTKVAFFLPETMTARLEVFDVAGRRVRTLRNNLSPAGWNAETWDGRDAAGHNVASGAYFVRLAAGGKTATDRLVRIR